MVACQNSGVLLKNLRRMLTTSTRLYRQPLPSAAQHQVRHSLLEACALSLATLGHVDAADQLALSLRHSKRVEVADDDSMCGRPSTASPPPTFEQYRAAANLRRRLQEGELEAATEVQQLLQGSRERLLLLKLHRAVVLQLLLSDLPPQPCGSEQQMKVRKSEFTALLCRS